MMGPSHAMSGAVAYLGIASYGGSIAGYFATQDPAVLVMGTLVTAGAALAPDIDSHSSTITSSFGIFGKLGHQVVNALSLTVYNGTRTRYDANKGNGHRTFFHTTFLAIIAGIVVAFFSALGGEVTILDKDYTWGQVASILTMFIFTHLALAGLFEPMRKARRKYGPYVMMLASLGITVTIAAFMPEDSNYPWLGACVTLGWIMHLLGDMITKMGVPMAFPFKIRGKRWWDVTLPSAFRITAGGGFEKGVIVPALTIALFVLTFLAIPGVQDTVNKMLS